MLLSAACTLALPSITLRNNEPWGLVANEADHEDLAQDIFIRVYRNLSRFQFRSRLATWISRIAYHTCLNHLRQRKIRARWSREREGCMDRTDNHATHQRADFQSAAVPTPHAVLCQKEIDETMRGLIQQLPPQQRLIVSLHYLDGFGIPELSETLDMPAGTIKSHLFRARARLKESLLANYQPEDLIE